MKDLIVQIINDEELSVEDKSNFIEKIVKASHGMDRFVTPGFYFHTDINKETGEIDIALWYRNVDEYGTKEHGPTNYDNSQIVEMMKQGYSQQRAQKK